MHILQYIEYTTGINSYPFVMGLVASLVSTLWTSPVTEASSFTVSQAQKHSWPRTVVKGGTVSSFESQLPWLPQRQFLIVHSSHPLPGLCTGCKSETKGFFKTQTPRPTSELHSNGCLNSHKCHRWYIAHPEVGKTLVAVLLVWLGNGEESSGSRCYRTWQKNILCMSNWVWAVCSHTQLKCVTIQHYPKWRC